MCVYIYICIYVAVCLLLITLQTRSICFHFLLFSAICFIHHPIYDFYWFLNDSLMTLFTFSLKSLKITKYVFFLSFFAPWQETFADAGDGDGGGDHLGSFYDHFRTIVEPPMQNIYVFRPKIIFLEMAYTIFVSSTRSTGCCSTR